MNYYRRVRDSQMVPASEALDGKGVIKDGYAASFSHGQRFAQPGDYISFDMAFMDSARPAGSPAASSLSANDQAAVIARAAMIHRTSTAYLGDRAPAFTEAMAHLAVQKAQADVTRLQANDAACADGAARLRIEAEVARAQMIDNLRNAWRK